MTSSYCPQITIADWSEPESDLDWVGAKKERNPTPEKLLLIQEAVLKALTSQSPSLERELQSLRENRNGDWDTPTDFAYSFATHITQQFKVRIPLPFLTTDDCGGIRMIWHLGGKQVIANFGATPEARSYIYSESEAEYGTQDLTYANLSSRIQWMNE